MEQFGFRMEHKMIDIFSKDLGLKALSLESKAITAALRSSDSGRRRLEDVGAGFLKSTGRPVNWKQAGRNAKFLTDKVLGLDFLFAPMPGAEKVGIDLTLNPASVQGKVNLQGRLAGIYTSLGIGRSAVLVVSPPEEGYALLSEERWTQIIDDLWAVVFDISERDRYGSVHFVDCREVKG